MNDEERVGVDDEFTNDAELVRISEIRESNNMTRQRIRRSFLYIIVFFLLARFIVLSVQSNEKKSNSPTGAPNSNNNDKGGSMLSEMNSLINAIIRDKQNKNPGTIYPDAIKGLYRGSYSNISTPIIPYVDEVHSVMESEQLPLSSFGLLNERGKITIHIIEETTFLDEFKLRGIIPMIASSYQDNLYDIRKVRGIMAIEDGENADEDFVSHVSLIGFYFYQTGKVTLYGNSRYTLDHYILDWNKTMDNVQTPKARDLLTRNLDEEPPSNEMNSDCLLTLNLQMDPLHSTLSPQDLQNVGDDTYLDDDGPKMDALKLNGFVTSTNCNNFALNINTTSVMDERMVMRAVSYSFFVSLITLVEIVSFVKQMQASSTESRMQRISVYSIWIQALSDFYLCLFHILAGLVWDDSIQSMATVAFLKLFLSLVFELRFMLFVWKSQRITNNSDFNTQRREITTLYTRYYFSLLIGIILIYQFGSSINFFVFVALSFWVPQIIHNVIHDTTALTPYFIFSVSITRLLLPIYFYLCPYSLLGPILEYKGDTSFGIFLVFWVLFQVIILLLQKQFHSRFFIPSKWLPHKYNYYRRVNDDDVQSTHEQGSSDCVICMCSIEFNAPSEYMITPCNHLFHRPCLAQWMEIKSECPVCRFTLPLP